MLTSAQFFRYSLKLTSCAIGDPSLTLVRNDIEFGLLISGSVREDPITKQLYLDDVCYLRICGNFWSYTDFVSIVIYKKNNAWLAQDTESGRYFPYPSICPYHIIFINHTEFQSIKDSRAKNLAFPVFVLAQQHFGKLPGFSFSSKCLETPDNYATQNDAIHHSEYLFPPKIT